MRLCWAQWASQSAGCLGCEHRCPQVLGPGPAGANRGTRRRGPRNPGAAVRTRGHRPCLPLAGNCGQPAGDGISGHSAGARQVFSALHLQRLDRLKVYNEWPAGRVLEAIHDWHGRREATTANSCAGRGGAAAASPPCRDDLTGSMEALARCPGRRAHACTAVRGGGNSTAGSWASPSPGSPRQL